MPSMLESAFDPDSGAMLHPWKKWSWAPDPEMRMTAVRFVVPKDKRWSNITLVGDVLKSCLPLVDLRDEPDVAHDAILLHQSLGHASNSVHILIQMKLVQSGALRVDICANSVWIASTQKSRRLASLETKDVCIELERHMLGRLSAGIRERQVTGKKLDALESHDLDILQFICSSKTAPTAISEEQIKKFMNLIQTWKLNGLQPTDKLVSPLEPLHALLGNLSKTIVSLLPEGTQSFVISPPALRRRGLDANALFTLGEVGLTVIIRFLFLGFLVTSPRSK